jgi:hypothetical protein
VRAATYEISVEGILPERDRTEFEGMQVEVGSGVTVLTGDLVDQAALHGVLARLEALGLRLFEVRKRPPAKAAKPR